MADMEGVKPSRVWYTKIRVGKSVLVSTTEYCLLCELIVLVLFRTEKVVGWPDSTLTVSLIQVLGLDGRSKESLTGPTDNTDSNYRRTWEVERLNIYVYRILIVFTSKCCTVSYAIRASRSWDSKQCETEEEIKENRTVLWFIL